MRFSTLTRSARDTVIGFGLGGTILLTAALAADVATLDVDGDGLVSAVELQSVYMDVTDDQFAALDADGNGGLDDAELTVGYEASLLPSDG